MDNAKTKKPILFIVILIPYIVCILLGLEIFLRFTDNHSRVGATYDKRLGWRYKKNSNFNWVDDNGMKIKFHTNKEGFRDRNHSLTKANTTIRILILGDSYATAIRIPDGNTFADILKEKLNTLNIPQNKNIELINASIGGWGTDQQLRYLKETGIKYKPDIVILFMAPNDIRDSYVKKFYRLTTTLEETNEPTISFFDQIEWFLQNHSETFQFLRSNFRNPENDRHIVLRIFPPELNIAGKPYLDTPLFLKRPPKVILQAQALFNALLLEMNKTCIDNKAKLFIVVLPTKMEYDDTLNKTDHSSDKVFSFVKSIALKENISFLNLKQLFDRAQKPMDYFFETDLHYSQTGHKIIADFLHNELKEYILKHAIK